MSLARRLRVHEPVAVDPAHLDQVDLRLFDADYAKLADLVADLRKRQSEINDRISELIPQYRQASKTARDGVPGMRPAVAALLGKPDAPTLIGIERQLAELERDKKDTQDAIDAIEPDLSRARARAGAAVCKRLEAYHAAMVERMGKALAELDEAYASYHQFADDLDSNGIARASILWQWFNPLHNHMTNFPFDRSRGQDEISRWRQAAHRAGFDV